MTADLSPLRLLLVTLAGWINRYQQHVIESVLEENRVLRDQLKGQRIRLTDDQRRRLAAKGYRLGRRLLGQMATIVTPDTILRWHRRLIAAKWTYVAIRPGRPGTMKAIASLIVRMALENPGWGDSRIQGALKNLDHRVARSTVARVLKDHGIPPAPDRPSSWRTFLRAHWGKIAAADFFTTEVWTPRGLVTCYTLFVLDLRSRRVHLAGSTPTPDGAFMAQANANAYAERFVRTVREECLDRLIQPPQPRRDKGLANVLANPFVVSATVLQPLPAEADHIRQ